MTYTTRTFDYLLELPNIQGVGYDENTNTLIVDVDEKVADDELEPDERIQEVVTEDVNLKIEAIGELTYEGIDYDTDYADTKDKHRPCTAGLSNNGGTENVLAKVVDVDAAEATWDTNLVSNGDTVRLSNNHVYWTDDELVVEEIGQPDADSPLGKVCGGVKRWDGDDDCRTDVAARTCYDLKDESAKGHLLPGDYPTGVFRGTWSNLVGEDMIKTGGRTGVTSNEITNYSYTANLSGGPIYDCMRAYDYSKAGDSGSAVYRRSTGEYLGLHFAGSTNYSIFCKATNVEADLGVEILTAKQVDPTSGATLSGQSTNGVRIPMQDPAEQSIEPVDIEYTFDPQPGETTEARVTFKGSQTGDFYVDVQGARYHEFSFEDSDIDRIGTYDAYYTTVAVNIEAPDSFEKGFDVDVSAGYYA